ncbi:MAG TPA: hypothetical protein VLX68_14735 [Chitinivibrionales bacterium]|nr:hypothetical protein [Chitinivibrionales bacterium]
MPSDEKKEPKDSPPAGEKHAPVVEAVIFSQDEPRRNDFIQFFLFRCREMRWCYENIARLIRGSAQKKLLKNMAERKRNHERSLIAAMGNADEIMDKTERQVLSPFVQYMLDINLRNLTTINEVFIFISNKEKKELELFSKLADLEENDVIKGLFLEQSQACRGHLSGLDEDFSHVTLGGALEF